MKGYIYHAPGQITLKEIPLPACGDGDIIVKNLYSGICGSDVTAYFHGGESMRIYPGSEFGHEMISRVVAVGKAVEGITVGDRVYPYPIFAKGSPARSASVGGFSEYVHLPNCKLNHSVYKIDDAIPDQIAALMEPFTVGARAASLSNPQPGQNAIVFGAGIIGIASAIVLKHLGCEKVMLVNRSTFRLDIAKRLGFAVCSPVQENLFETATAYFGQAAGPAGPAFHADIFIDATGSDDAYAAFEQYGMRGSVCTIVGLHHKPLSVNALLLSYGRKRIQGSGGYSPAEVQLVLEIMRSGAYDLASLITQVYPLERLDEAIRKAATSSESLKVMIHF